MNELSILEISQCIFCMEIWPFLVFFMQVSNYVNLHLGIVHY